MIHEIANFVDYLERSNPDIFKENLELKQGLYAFVRKGDEKMYVPEDKILQVDKDTEKDLLYEQFLERASNSEMINAMKSFNSGPKIYIAIGSPFGIALSGKAYKERSISRLHEAADAYFRAAQKYVDKKKKQHLQWLEDMKQFVDYEMVPFLEKQVADINKLSDKYMFYFFLEGPAPVEYKEIQDRFLAQKLFNKDKYNIKGEDGYLYGISDDASGFNDSKAFLKHQTGPLDVNYRVSGETAKKLYQFFRLQQKNKILPNPMPVFVDKEELSKEAIVFYKKNHKYGHKEIVEHLMEYKSGVMDDSGEQLQNYYLIFFNNGLKGNRIQDLDFVPVFRYKTPDMPKVIPLFQITSKDNKKVFHDKAIDNIFQFQSAVLNMAFNGQLIRETKNGVWLRYFDDMDHKPEYGATATIVDLFYKYKKALYDYVYKSRTQAITHTMFYDIMVSSILDDIRHDDARNKDYSIKQKLNVWFSFYEYFNPNNVEDMVNKTEEIHKKLLSVGKNEDTGIGSDPEFAFASGQLIRAILNKSEAAERSHALLEPFLQKSDAKLFKLEIARAFETYKHAFPFYRGNKRYAFDIIMSEVMGFEPRTKNMKNLLPFILAGYFAETVFKKEEVTEKEQEQE